MRSTHYGASIGTLAIVGNHLPRKCGIATFTTDLLNSLMAEAPDADCWAIAINDTPEGYPYPTQVRFELNQKNLQDYRLAAEFLNMKQVDTVSLQHEFGIFGGKHGAHILELARNLRMPIITTLHTVLKNPNEIQRSNLREIGRLSDRLVVMSHKARELSQEVYGIPGEKIELVPHGIPDVPFVDPNYYKDQFGVEGRKVILTFGLLSPGKGIEHMIDALPEVVRIHPDAVYVVLGATHPHVKRDQGEAYRYSLQRRARSLGVEDHLIFHNRFVELEELCEFLGAADIYVTPYLNDEQIVSGTLAYALGAGKATISTPYWYAQEMLADGRGRLVPFNNPEALSAEIVGLIDNEVERHAMRKRAYHHCRDMIWKEVARKYLEVLAQVKEERERQPRPVYRAATLQSNPLELPKPKFDHLKRLTDDVGVLQHAKYIVPDRDHGYCTDDNARALIAVLLGQELLPEDDILVELSCVYLGFLLHAYNDSRGRFRNFMSYDRRWLEEQGSEDSHGRALWALGMAVALSKSENLTAVALNLFEKAMPAMNQFESPRTCAFALVGIHAYLRKFSGDAEIKRSREKLAERIFGLFQANASNDWPWIEDIVTYANGKIPHALLLSGQWLQRGEMVEAGLRSLEWLLRIQTDASGHFSPVGNHGWYPKGGEKARFDQQPLEASDMIEACREAYNVTGDERWIKEAQHCFEWFLGRNDVNAPLYDYKTGGCCDGLSADGVNFNQGAESTLAWLLSLLSMQAMRVSLSDGVMNDRLDEIEDRAA
ncbi:MAG: glycosyltransferase family 4 protein [Deltaproteobacteria bacterium]|nr:glycosyltransferase family 4 protein [Deltaproteobacteria bacterium]MBW2330114.1 glycosyltransferase family 4 protein [Deltaproteobacteria bacterium]